MTIVLIDKTSGDKDELYCRFFKCPDCKNGNVHEGANYCSNCGAKIEWT